MANAPPVSNSTPTGRPKRASIKGPLIFLVVALVVATAIFALAKNRRVATETYASLLGAASPALSGMNAINIQVGPTPAPTPSIETIRTRVTVPASGTGEVRLSLKQGDKLIGIFDADEQVDFSLWILTAQRQRLLQQVRVQGESTFSWAAEEDGDYMLQFTSPRDTNVTLAYAVKEH